MKLTAAQRKALSVLVNHVDGGVTPTEFAEEMWPDSPGWHRVSNVGRGATKGVGIRRAGGAYLARLEAKGWARTDYLGEGALRHYITTEGQRVLSEDTP